MLEGDPRTPGDYYSAQPPGATPTEPGPPTSIPWQCRERYRSALTAMYETIKVVLLEPSRAFSNMQVENSLGRALIYVLILGSIGGIAGQAMTWLFQTALVAAQFLPEMHGEAMALTMLSHTTTLLLRVIFVPVAIIIGAFVGAGVLHLCLLILGGANRGFEATFSVLAYCTGSTALLQLIPCCGGPAHAIWNIVIQIIGLAQAQQISTGKAALAIFLPLIFCCGGSAVLLLGFIMPLVLM